MNIENIEISSEMLGKLEEVENAIDCKNRQWTPEEDAIILKYYKTKNKEDLAEKVFNCSYKTLLKRWKELND